MRHTSSSKNVIALFLGVAWCKALIMLTETEIMECLVENFRLAADNCAKLANVPAAGMAYNDLRHQLLLIEGACRQAGVWRGDSRWFQIGLMMNEAHNRAGDWLRGHLSRKLFTKLGENLLAGLKLAEGLRDKATGRSGIILPDMAREIRTQGRPIQVVLPEMFADSRTQMRPTQLMSPHSQFAA